MPKRVGRSPEGPRLSVQATLTKALRPLVEGLNSFLYLSTVRLAKHRVEERSSPSGARSLADYWAAILPAILPNTLSSYS